MADLQCFVTGMQQRDSVIYLHMAIVSASVPIQVIKTC